MREMKDSGGRIGDSGALEIHSFPIYCKNNNWSSRYTKCQSWWSISILHAFFYNRKMQRLYFWCERHSHGRRWCGGRPSISFGGREICSPSACLQILWLQIYEFFSFEILEHLFSTVMDWIRTEKSTITQKAQAKTKSPHQNPQKGFTSTTPQASPPHEMRKGRMA